MVWTIRKQIAFSLGVSAVIVLLSGFLPNSRGILGVTRWGYPFPWIHQIVYPGAPKTIIWHLLILDWVIVALLIFGVIYGRTRLVTGK